MRSDSGERETGGSKAPTIFDNLGEQIFGKSGRIGEQLIIPKDTGTYGYPADLGIDHAKAEN